MHVASCSRCHSQKIAQRFQWQVVDSSMLRPHLCVVLTAVCDRWNISRLNERNCSISLAAVTHSVAGQTRGLIYNRCVRTERAWDVRTPLLTQTLGFIKTNLTGKFAYFHANSDPCVWTLWRRGSGDADVRWWTEADHWSTSSFTLKPTALVVLAPHICSYTNLLIKKYIKQFTANYVQIPLNSGVTEPSH